MRRSPRPRAARCATRARARWAAPSRHCVAERRPAAILPSLMRRALRALSTVLIAGGILLIADAGLTLVWQEPVSALYARIQQHDLKGRLVELERSGPTHAEKLALKRLKSDPRRMAFLARALRR